MTWWHVAISADLLLNLARFSHC